MEKHKKLNIDLLLKNLFTSKMESEEFLSLLQVCTNCFFLLNLKYILILMFIVTITRYQIPGSTIYVCNVKQNRKK